MSTAAELCSEGALIKVTVPLGSREFEERTLYILPEAADWLRTNLQDIEQMTNDSQQSPREQLDDLFHMFISGASFDAYYRCHVMQPSYPGVWELKSTDLRLFGWFPSRGTFIIVAVNSTYACKLHELYPAYRDSVVRIREQMDIDEPKFISGGYESVL